MAKNRIELEREPGRYVSGRRAEALIARGQARRTARGTLELLAGAPRADEVADERTWWSPLSAGHSMMGAAVNRG